MNFFAIHTRQSVDLEKVRPKGLKCPNCNAVGTTVITIVEDVVMSNSLLPMPIMPLDRDGRSKCLACGQEFISDKMPASIRAEYHQHYAKASSPIIFYFWTILIAVIVIGAVAFGVKATYFNDENLLADPKQGDLYETHLNDQYSVMRVADVSVDSLMIEKGQFGYEDPINDLELAASYQDFGSKIQMGRSYILSMYEKGEIVDITRPEK